MIVAPVKGVIADPLSMGTINYANHTGLSQLTAQGFFYQPTDSGQTSIFLNSYLRIWLIIRVLSSKGLL